MEYILSTQNLTKVYKKTKAIDSVNLHIQKGDIYGFIGRNGAGKTTTLKIIGGLAYPTNGGFSIFGYDYSELRKNNVFSRIGLLIEDPGIFPDMNAYDNLKVKCICAGIKRPGYIEDILQLIGLESAGKKKAKNFSLGMKQRLGIGIALIGDPDLLLLDEPINGLDPQGIAEVRNTILKLNKERNITIVISSHILEELSKISTRYGIINQGHLLLELSSNEIAEKCKAKIKLRVEQVAQACTVLEKIGITNYKVESDNTIYIYEMISESSMIGMNLAKANIPVHEISVVSDTLEDYFFSITGGNANA